jgi:hypothetical protein
MRISNFSRPNEGMMTISKRMTFRGFLLAATVLASPLIVGAATPASAQVAVGISVQIAPPLLPVYVQPPMPDVGYMWTPGYWAYGQVGYYWVPGTWIQPPMVGVLWTPPYWGWSNGAYLFNNGYWGPHVGFYGGVNYGYGYGGGGYDGGRWNGNNFDYNRSANNFGSVHVEHAYEQNLTVNNRSNVSYVGGANGLKAEPTAEERTAANERHTPGTAEQTRNITAAASNPAFAASHNNGHPAITATSRPAEVGRAGANAHPASTAEHAAEPAAGAHPAVHAAEPGAVAHPAEHAAEPAAVAHPAEHAAGPAAVAHPAEHAAEPAAVAHPAVHAAEPAAQNPAVAHAVARPAAPAAHNPAVAHAVARPAAPAAHNPAVTHAVARPAAPAAPHPAAAHTAAAPRAAPAHEAKPEEKK